MSLDGTQESSNDRLVTQIPALGTAYMAAHRRTKLGNTQSR